MACGPTTGHSAKFRAAAPDGRLTTKTFERNIKPVIDGLLSFAADADGQALEIGSGTGQHVCALANHFPDLIWTPSDPDDIHCASIQAWRNHTDAPTRPVLKLDAAADWASDPQVIAITPLKLILSMNVIHITAFAVAQGIAVGAGKALAIGGYLAFYGPFREQGEHTGDGNRIFDTRLRADNPDWGIRDVDDLADLAGKAGLDFQDLIEMPANNRLLVFVRN